MDVPVQPVMPDVTMTQVNKHKNMADETKTATIEWQVLSPTYEVKGGGQFDPSDVVRDNVIGCLSIWLQ